MPESADHFLLEPIYLYLMILNTHHVFKLHVKLGSFMSCFQQVFSPTHVPILPRGRRRALLDPSISFGSRGSHLPRVARKLGCLWCRTYLCGEKKKNKSNLWITGNPFFHNHGSVENYLKWKETNIGGTIFHIMGGRLVHPIMDGFSVIFPKFPTVECFPWIPNRQDFLGLRFWKDSMRLFFWRTFNTKVILLPHLVFF